MLLELSGTGYGPHWRPTGRRVELFADWVEAQALIVDRPLAKPELVDRLEGTGLIKDSDDAWRLIQDAFSACKRRAAALNEAYPFQVTQPSISPTGADCLAYRFCLWSSLPEQFAKLRTTYPSEFRNLFEALVAHSLRATMPGWTVHETGWSAIAEDGKGQIAKRVAEWSLGKFLDAKVFQNANDAQVDVAVVRRFPDGRSGIPLLLGQCATGILDWREKRARPNLDRWAKAVQFSAQPVKLFAVPFALDPDSFFEATCESNGLILDRVRICGGAQPVGEPLEGQIRSWLNEAINQMPEAA